MYNTYRKQGGIIVAKVGNRQNKTLVCTVCGKEGYRKSKNVKNTTDRLELSKYCSNCRKHTNHTSLARLIKIKREEKFIKIFWN